MCFFYEAADCLPVLWKWGLSEFLELSYQCVLTFCKMLSSLHVLLQKLGEWWWFCLQMMQCVICLLENILLIGAPFLLWLTF